MTPSPQARSSAEKVNGKPPARAAFCIQNAAVAAFRMRRRRGAVCGTAAAAPRTRPRKLHILRSAASGRTHTFRCSSSPNCNRCAGLQFASSSSCGKRYGRKGRWGREIALTRLKKHFASVCHSPIALPTRNALRAVVESGFPSARHAVRVVLSAPVEYLTYGSRTKPVLLRGVGADAESARLRRPGSMAE